ncbi:MAG: leucine-rich repeat domain-containing protein [Thermoanaerobaculia bacterium]
MRRFSLNALAVLVFIAATSAVAQVPQAERDALVAIYNATGGPSWTNRSGWLGAAGTECTWAGVFCEGGRVVNLYLQENGLSGTIPPETGNLTALRDLFLSANTNLSGALPASLANLTSLERFAANNNSLSGTLSPVASLPRVRELYLSANEFSGEVVVPPSPDLVALNLNNNLLVGSIPASISSRTQLRTVFLNNNQLTGPIPADIGNLTQLEVLSLGVNRISGAIPPSIGSLTKLRALGLAENALTGTIPESLSNLVALEEIYLSVNELTGPIPSGIGNLKNLAELWMNNNRLSGELPAGLGSMPNLVRLYLSANRLTGTIPAGLSNATKLTHLVLDNNDIQGAIPPLGNLKQLVELWLYNNRLTGAIPGDIVTLPKLKIIFLSNNDLSGSIPAGLAQLSELDTLVLSGNQLTGTLPAEIASMSTLRFLHLAANQLSGSIPGAYFNLPNLEELALGSNLLSGSVPNELGNATKLTYLHLSSNQLRGTVPAGVVNLTNTYYLDLGRNSLVAPNASVLEFLQSKSSNDFARTQTVPPTDVRVDSASSFTVSLSWNPIAYGFDPGGYQVLASTTPGGPYTPLLTTPAKYIPEAIVTGLNPSTKYYFAVKTVTFPHGGGNYYQLNTIFSDASAEVTATTQTATESPANVIVTSYPQALAQAPGQAGGTDGYTLTNIGGTPATITLTQSGSFFTQSPASFTIQPGANQTVALAGLAQAEGEYSGASIPNGNGIEPGLQISVRLVVAPAPQGVVSVAALSSRVDLVAPEGTNPSGQLSFQNNGTSTFKGVLVSDVEFLVPQPGLVTIAPGGSVSLSVTADRAKRSDAALLNGTQVGRASLFSLPVGSGARSPFSGATSVSLVSVVDTVKPPTAGGTIPALGAGEVALFMPAVGHVRGSVGEFLSDISIVNAYGASTIPDLKLFYTAIGGTSTTVASLNAVGAGQSVGLADVVKSVFGEDAQIGTLQIRSTKAVNLSASANIFNASNPLGNYGTSIPVFRSDRAANSSRPIVLTGLRKDASGHTNFYVQETAGSSASVSLEFLNAAGNVVGGRDVTVAPFGVATVVDPLVEGSVAVRVVTTSGDGVVAYATPVDRASGDTWAVTDWSLLYGFNPAETVVIPIGGSVRGANDSYFRTDVALTNRCATVGKSPGEAGHDPLDPCTSSSGSGVLRFYPTTGGVVEKEISLGLLQSVVFGDVLRSAFNLENDAVGHIVFTPASDAFAITSRTYTTVSGSPATFGSSVPALGSSIALRPGQSRRVGGLQDSTRRTIGARAPATNRTNFGLVETSGAPAKVRVSVYYNNPRSLAAGQPIGVKEYDLAANQLVSKSNLVEEIIGVSRETLYGDLTEVQVQFDVVSSTGAVMIFISSVDNGTNDSIIRVE